MKRPVLSTLMLLAALGATSASAHHSFAMFDNEKQVTLDGTVKDFQWSNPHSWLQIIVKDSSGKPVQWAIEMTSPNSLARTGWRRTSLKPGDHAVIVIHPLKDKSAGGSLVNATVNGVKIGTQDG